MLGQKLIYWSQETSINIGSTKEDVLDPCKYLINPGAPCYNYLIGKP